MKVFSRHESSNTVYVFRKCIIVFDGFNDSINIAIMSSANILKWVSLETTSETLLMYMHDLKTDP